MSHRHSVSIIDDDLAVRDSMRILLEGHDLKVSNFASAEEYLQRPRSNCVVIADIGMSTIGGLDLVEVLREAEIPTPAIIMADVIEPRLVERIRAAAPCIRMIKPINPVELLETIGVCCRTRACAALHT